MTSENAKQTAAIDSYAAAYAAHYSSKNLREALHLYLEVIESYPESPEARYSRTQIFNVVRGVVPESAIFDSQLKLAFAFVGHQVAEDAAVSDARAAKGQSDEKNDGHDE